MVQRVPLTVRASLEAESSDKVVVALVTFTHPDLAAPIRVSSDPTQRLSLSPLKYGTVSNGNTFDFILMTAIVPDDMRASPPRTALQLDNVTAGLVELARSFSTYATATIELVMANQPDFVFQSYRRLMVTQCSFDESSVTFDMSREPFFSEPHGKRALKHLLPGLYTTASA
jgi:hypothetical protein